MEKTHHYLMFNLGVSLLKEKFIQIYNQLLLVFMSPPQPMWSSSAYTSHLESRLEF